MGKAQACLQEACAHDLLPLLVCILSFAYEHACHSLKCLLEVLHTHLGNEIQLERNLLPHVKSQVLAHEPATHESCNLSHSAPLLSNNFLDAPLNKLSNTEPALQSQYFL